MLEIKFNLIDIIKIHSDYIQHYIILKYCQIFLNQIFHIIIK
jgi:hypothetical protein